MIYRNDRKHIQSRGVCLVYFLLLSLQTIFSKWLIGIMSAMKGICFDLSQYILICGNFMMAIITSIPVNISISLWSKPIEVPVVCTEYWFVYSLRRSMRPSSKNCLNYNSEVLSSSGGGGKVSLLNSTSS